MINRFFFAKNTKIVKTPQLMGVFFFVPIILLFIGCENDLSKLPESALAPEEAMLDKATDVIFIVSKNGKVNVKLSSDYYESNQHALPPYMDMRENLKIEFYNDSTEVSSTLTATYGRLYLKTNDMLVKDSVKIVNTKGEIITTDELYYNHGLDRIFTEKHVTINNKGNITHGEGLEATSDLSYIKLIKQRGIIPVNESNNDLQNAPAANPNKPSVQPSAPRTIDTSLLKKVPDLNAPF